MLRVNQLNGFSVGRVGTPGGGGGSGETGALLDAAVIPFAINTGTGTQDITAAPYGGGTPKLAMYHASAAGALKTDQAGAAVGFGATDGTNQFAANAFSADGQTSGAGLDRIVGVTDKCILRLDSTAIGSEAAHSAFLADGVRINITDDWPSTVRQTAIVMGGADLTVAVGTVTPVVGAGATVALGWQPDAIIFYGSDGAFSDTVFTGFRAIQGFAAWDSVGTLAEVCAGVRADTGSTRLYRTAVANDASIFSISATADAYTFKGNVSRSGTGFTVTSDATAIAIGYVALKITGGKCKAGTWALPTGTGGSSKTGIGFKPKLVLIAGTERTAVGGPSSGTLFGMAALSREPRAASLFGSWVSDGAAQGGGAPSDTRHTVDDQGIYGLTATGGGDFDIEMTSMDADGWTVNVVDAPAGAYLWPYLAIG